MKFISSVTARTSGNNTRSIRAITSTLIASLAFTAGCMGLAEQVPGVDPVDGGDPAAERRNRGTGGQAMTGSGGATVQPMDAAQFDGVTPPSDASPSSGGAAGVDASLGTGGAPPVDASRGTGGASPVDARGSGGTGVAGAGMTAAAGRVGTGTGGASTATGGAPSVMPATMGFTTFTASADTRKVYVSSSTGNDANTGLTETTAVQTIARGKTLLRAGYPDWLLLKKGDSWTESLGFWRVSGRSQTEPMMVWSYGTGAARPELKTGTSNGLQVDGSSGTPASVTHVAFVGLRFYADRRDPASPTFGGAAASATSPTGIFWLRGTDDLLVEDCMFQSYKDNIAIQDLDRAGLTNVRLRHDIVVDAYSGDTGSHAQGMYFDAVNGLLIEGCVFDHNGWNDRVVGAEPTIYNHNMYVQVTNRNVTLRDNVVMRASSHGAQLRPGGTAVGNVFLRNPIGLLIGGGDAPVAGGVVGMVQGNLLLEGGDITPSLARGWGIDLSNIQTAMLTGNIIAHVTSLHPGAAIADNANASYLGNVVFQWGTGRFVSSGPFLDGQRSISTYDASAGGAGSFQNFVDNARAQSRDHWRPEYAAPAIISYFKAGFAAP